MRTVGVVALALPPQPRDPVRWHPGDHALGDRQLANPVQSVEQAVRIRRIAAGLVTAQPDEARDAVRCGLGQHPLQLAAGLRVEPAGDALHDPPLGRDERVRTCAFDRGRPWHDHPAPPQFLQHRGRQRVARARHLRLSGEPIPHRLRRHALEGAEAVEPLQGGGVLVVGL